MNKARSFKIGDVVQIRPEAFPLTGLPENAAGELRVDEYGEHWHGRYTLEVVAIPSGETYNVMESEVIFIR